MKKTVWLWVAAVIITLAAVVFQRKTGPTYPKKVQMQLDTVAVELKLPRSHNTDSVLSIAIPMLSWDWTARLYHRPYPTQTDWLVEPFFPEGEQLIAYFPIVSQKAAKLEYFIELSNLAQGQEFKIPGDDPIIIRYKGSVPAWALIPHILFIFVALIASNLTGLMAIFNHARFRFYGVLTLALTLVGGFIFGPIVQKFAFDHYWTGFPFGSDLTDNKILIMFLLWVIAVILNTRKKVRWVTILASLATIVVYCIPHSLRGSEFDYKTGEIVTGFISFFNGWLF